MSDSAATVARYLFVSDPVSLTDALTAEPKAMYRLACRECGEAFNDSEKPVESRSIKGAPLVHEECA